MAKYVERPIIFPLSNPDENCEANPQDVINWTEGRAILATGTKFPDAHFQGKTIEIGQCNNYTIFPAMGLGVMASAAKRVTEGMFLAAALKLSTFSPAIQDPTAPLFPSPESVREIAKKLALEVGLQAQKEQVAPLIPREELVQRIEENFWEPNYSRFS